MTCFECSPEFNPPPPPGAPAAPPAIVDNALIEVLPNTGFDFLLVGILAAALVIVGVLLVYLARWLWTLEPWR